MNRVESFCTSLAQKRIYYNKVADTGEGDPAACLRLHAHLYLGLSPGEKKTNHTNQCVGLCSKNDSVKIEKKEELLLTNQAKK